ncbi:hypothetical protein JW877_08660, partial [bacterium]|nr:hypothetical protein [bacterium]
GTNPHLVGPLFDDTVFVASYSKHFRCVVEKEPFSNTLGWLGINSDVYYGAASNYREEWFEEGSMPQLSVSDPDLDPANGLRYLYSHWSDGGARTHFTAPIIAPTIFTAFYDKQFQCTVQKSHLRNYGDIIIDGVTYPNTFEQNFWTYSGSTYELTVTTPDGAGDTLYNFDHWSEGGDPSPTHITLPVDTNTVYTAVYDTEYITIELTAIPSSWDLGIIGLYDTRTMTEGEVIILGVRSPYNVNLGLRIANTGLFWSSGYAPDEDKFVLRARFDDNYFPPPLFQPSLDYVKTTLTWATEDVFGPGGINIPSDSSENLWLQFIAPVLSTTFDPQTIILEVWVQVDLP